MKLSKVLLLASALLLVACNSNNITSSNTPASTVISSSVDSSEESSSTTSESTSSANASSIESSSSSNSNISSSETPVADKTLTINLFNPTCGSVSTEALDAKLLEYINQEAGTTFVSAIKNTSCQIINDAPNKGNKVLVIGFASSQGSLEFTFAETIKSITITAQTYHKPYKDYATGNTIPNVDANSVLYVDTNTIDLKPVNGEPVEKEYIEELNAKTLKLTNSGEEKSRVFIKSLTFVY
ncbi:MAG: hypothetical protein J6I84_07720 [Bacilli bacterium]|nr:hypothetical protein [Bacilli bacterium]